MLYEEQQEILSTTANSSIAKIGKTLILQNSRLWTYSVSFFFTKSQVLVLCSVQIIKLDVTQQVKDSRTGFFQVFRQGQELCLLENFIDTTVWSQHTKQHLSHKRKCPNKVDSQEKNFFFSLPLQEKDSA